MGPRPTGKGSFKEHDLDEVQERFGLATRAQFPMGGSDLVFTAWCAHHTEITRTGRIEAVAQMLCHPGPTLGLWSSCWITHASPPVVIDGAVVDS